MNFMAEAWDGREPLWKVYWLYHFLGSIVIGCIFWGLFKISPYVAGSALPAYCGYYVWTIVSLWRCAFNAEWTFWSYIVRILVIMKPALVCFFILTFGLTAMVGKDLVKAAQCHADFTQKAKEVGMDYATYKSQHQPEWTECTKKAAAMVPAASTSRPITGMTVQPIPGVNAPSAGTYMKVNQQCNDLHQQLAQAMHMNWDEYTRTHGNEIAECKSRGMAAGAAQ